MAQINFINGQPAGDRYFDAECGTHFNEYVRRTRTADFEYDPHNGGSMTHTDLWKDRRLKIKMHSSPEAGWREARVVEWDEYLMGPFVTKARWDMTVEFTDIASPDKAADNSGNNSNNNAPQFDLGDVVAIHGLQKAPEHNEQMGMIRMRKEERFAVQYSNRNNKNVTVAVKPGNLRRLALVEFQVHRCNIEGGGVLDLNGSAISFEWLDEASPQIALRQDFQPLNWEDVIVDLSEEEIARQLEANSSMVPENRSSPDHVRNFQGMVQEVQAMTEDGSIISLMTGLKRFKQWILTHPIEIWGPSSFLKCLCRFIEAEFIEILFDYMVTIHKTDKYKRFVEGVMEETQRYGEQNGLRLCGFSEEGDEYMSDPLNHHMIQMIHVAEAIGVKYEERKEFYKAIHWYEINVEYIPSNFDVPPGRPFLFSTALGNLGLSQKRAGLFQTALETYRRALLPGGDKKHIKHNLRMLQEEMDEWKGSSGIITPRLDE